MFTMWLAHRVPQPGSRCRLFASCEELLSIRLVSADGSRTIEGVRRGELLRTALLRKGATPHNDWSRLICCRGIGSCGTCAVEVTEGVVEPSEWNTAEALRLNLPPHTGRKSLRLACQISVQSDLTVTKREGGWGQGEELAPARTDDKVSYLGDLEFILDRTSPPAAPCPACEGTQLVQCPLCMERAEYDGPAYDATQCRACKGSGQVVCRSCFSGNPWDLEGIREAARRRPD